MDYPIGHLFILIRLIMPAFPPGLYSFNWPHNVTFIARPLLMLHSAVFGVVL